MRKQKNKFLKKFENLLLIVVLLLGLSLLTVQYLHTHSNALQRFQPYMKYHGVFTDLLVNEVEGVIFLKGKQE